MRQEIALQALSHWAVVVVVVVAAAAAAVVVAAATTVGYKITRVLISKIPGHRVSPSRDGGGRSRSKSARV
jgi:uncharacterized protein involved in exopolysaccharide biosynthesis